MKKHTRKVKAGLRNATPQQSLSKAGTFLNGASKGPQEYLNGVPMELLKEHHDALAKHLRDEASLKAALSATQSAIRKEQKEVNRLYSGSIRVYQINAKSEADWLAVGIELCAPTNVSTGAPGTPTKFRAKPLPGGAKLLWRNPMRRVTCLLEYQEGSLDGPWLTHEDLVRTNGRLELNNLKPGVLYYFRVRAHNGREYSPWSDVVSVRAL